MYPIARTCIKLRHHHGLISIEDLTHISRCPIDKLLHHLLKLDKSERVSRGDYHSNVWTVVVSFGGVCTSDIDGEIFVMMHK